MAEKEERIVIKKEINYHPPYGGWRGAGEEIVLARKEAIERMAKALCADDVMREGYYQMAEAALDALLSSGESND